jgi:hypothetical protein
MSEMSNNMSIYLIVFLNAACHILLIWRLKLDRGAKWKYASLTIAIPVAVMLTMRLLVGIGLLHMRVAEQPWFERFFTILASVLLIAGPFLATGAGVVFSRKHRQPAGAPLTA